MSTTSTSNVIALTDGISAIVMPVIGGAGFTLICGGTGALSLHVTLDAGPALELGKALLQAAQVMEVAHG